MMKILILILMLIAGQAKAGVLMQGFYWDAKPVTGVGDNNEWWDEMARQADSLAAAGFTAIWIPPVLKGASGGYSNGYDPFDDYDIGSKDQRGTIPTRWGTRDHLLRAAAVFRSVGLDIYADMVLAHRGGDDGNKNFIYKNAFNQTGGGRFQKSSADFTSYDSPFGRNLDSSKDEVRKNLVLAGDWLSKTLGLQGMRIDYAKGMSPDFLKSYLGSAAMSQQFAVTEFWDENVEVLLNYVHQQMGGRVKTFDFPLWGRLKDMGNGQGFFNMRNLQGAGLVGRDPKSAVTFVENHDTDQNYPTKSGKQLGYAFILTSEGYPSVFWKDYFVYGLKTVIDNLVWIHEVLASGGTIYRWADDDLLVYERQGSKKLLVGLNDNLNSTRSELVQTGFGANQLLHDYTGHSSDRWTDIDGRVQLDVPGGSYVAFAPKGIDSKIIRKSYRTQQELSGAADLDMSPAIQDKPVTIGRIWVSKNTPIQWQLYFTHEGWTSESRIALKVTDPSGKILKVESYDQQTVPGKASVLAPSSGWYKIQTIAMKTPEKNKNIDYWLKLDYQAPVRIELNKTD